MSNSRLNGSLDDLTKDFLSPLNLQRRMSNNPPVDSTQEDLSFNVLLNLLEEIKNGAVRKPDRFNNFHFLLFLVYDAFAAERDRYPLWRWYNRIKKKLITSRNFSIESEKSKIEIFSVFEHLIEETTNLSDFLEEQILVDEQYRNAPVHALFKYYSPIHSFLYFENVERPIVIGRPKIFAAFKNLFVKIYSRTTSDLVQFSITHRKTDLLSFILQDNERWLDASINLQSERGWSILHYAAFVADKQTVKRICDKLNSQKTFDMLSLFVPRREHNEFDENPFRFVLRGSGVDRDVSSNSRGKFGLSSIDSILNKENSGRNSIKKSQGNLSTTADTDIPDADELELSSLPLIQREELIEKIVKLDETRPMFVPSPLVLGCLATCGDKADYDRTVEILLESKLFEYDGLNHECIFNRVLNFMQKNDFGSFQSVEVFRDTEIDDVSTLIFYDFDGFIVNQDVKPVSTGLSGSSATLNTSRYEESVVSDDLQNNEVPVSVRCFLTVLVLRHVFLHYPRWDFHLLRENIEEHLTELENALGCRPTILHPDGEIISSRKRTDVTWEVIVKYRLSSETGQTFFMQVDFCFFDSFADSFADSLVNFYQTPFYVSCLTDSTSMMDKIFDSYFKRRNLRYWGTIAEKQLEDCFDGVLQIKNNFQTFVSLCTILNRYYQIDGDPFGEENSSQIQRIFVHAFACCVRRNAKIELDYLIKSHALIFYDSCRTKPSEIRHNVLTYCVVRNLATTFDQLMSNMKATMYKTYQNSTNPDWQPHIAWREIIHVIIDPISQQNGETNEQSDLTRLASYGETNFTSTLIGNLPIVHFTGDEYLRSINARKNIILKAQRKPPRSQSDVGRHRKFHRMSSVDQQQIPETFNDLTTVPNRRLTEDFDQTDLLTISSARSVVPNISTLAKRSRNIFRNVHRIRWNSSKNERQQQINDEEKSKIQNNDRTNDIPLTSEVSRLMFASNQILIVPTEKNRSKNHFFSKQNENSIDDENGRSTPDITKIRSVPLVRISPPQMTNENLLDWDEEDRQGISFRRTKLIGNRQKNKTRQSLPKINEGNSLIVSPTSFDLNNSKRPTNFDLMEIRGQTLLHLAAKMAHDEILRLLICETSQASLLYNSRGQTPLLCAIEAGATSTATILMEQDPLSLLSKDSIGSNVFHYATEQRNDVLLSRAISLLKRLSSGTARMMILQRLIEKNGNGKTPFVIAIENGSLKCIKYILGSKWLHRNVDIGDLINADSLKTTIDTDQLEIASFFVSDTRRFAAIIQIQIDFHSRLYNVLEYSIALKKSDFVRTFISVKIPPEERETYRNYKNFLKRYNISYPSSTFDQTPIQRMLTSTEMVPLVPLLLEQFVGEDGIDLSVLDDCLRARPAANRCIFGRAKRFATSNWLKEHPLSLIAAANFAPVYDHDIVKMCVDLKFQLFGNFLYLLILCAQLFFVFLYTAVALGSPTPKASYYHWSNSSCKQLCDVLSSDRSDPLSNNIFLCFLRGLLLFCSFIAIVKELIQLITQREKYFRGFFVNFLEIHSYFCAILFAVDLNSCSQRTGLRCKWQWEAGALGMATVWTLLLLVFMNSLKIGKYGLLFVSVFLTFLKFSLIYIFIWIGYIIAFHMLFVNKKPQFQSIFYSIPKTLAMLTGEYDFDDFFFPTGKILQGSQAAMILFSIFVFTMNIVIMNIMVGLAVSDVKRFRLNAKREHLRARIETCLGLQAKFGWLCETCSRLVLAFSKRSLLKNFEKNLSQNRPIREYFLWKLELRNPRIEIGFLNQNSSSQSSSSKTNRVFSHREFVTCEIGFYRQHFDRAGEPLFEENDQLRFLRKTDELKETFEKSNARVQHELRKLTMSLQADFDEVKRKLIEN